ncbi:hypothetical protein CR513_51406, partial [Mucuna pruriens]
MKEVVKAEVLKLLDAGIIYPIFDMCTQERRNHNDGERPKEAHSRYSSYIQIPVVGQDKEKTSFTCLYGTFSYKRMPFGLYNTPITF